MFWGFGRKSENLWTWRERVQKLYTDSNLVKLCYCANQTHFKYTKLFSCVNYICVYSTIVHLFLCCARCIENQWSKINLQTHSFSLSNSHKRLFHKVDYDTYTISFCSLKMQSEKVSRILHIGDYSLHCALCKSFFSSSVEVFFLFLMLKKSCAFSPFLFFFFFFLQN